MVWYYVPLNTERSYPSIFMNNQKTPNLSIYKIE